MMMKRAIFALALSIPGTSVLADDLGVFGRVWDIEEVDLRRMMAEQIARVDQTIIQDELKTSSKNYLRTLPEDYLPKATATRTHWVDPSVVVSQDIYAPVEQEDGRYGWEVMVPAGTRVNPLTDVRPVDNMLFFNAKDPEQVEFALSALKAHPRNLMLVATGGDVGALSAKIQVPVYHSNPSLIERFEIRAIPSLLGIGTGPRELFLAVTEFEPPYDPRLIERAWNGLPDTLEITP